MNQNIEQVSHPRSAISKELYDKCMDKLTGADKLLASLEGVIAITSNPNPNPFEQLMKEVRAMPKKFEPAPFEMQPFEWPRYLDRSCMIKIDVTKIP
jgi:hypothetical protein